MRRRLCGILFCLWLATGGVQISRVRDYGPAGGWRTIEGAGAEFQAGLSGKNSRFRVPLVVDCFSVGPPWELQVEGILESASPYDRLHINSVVMQFPGGRVFESDVDADFLIPGPHAWEQSRADRYRLVAPMPVDVPVRYNKDEWVDVSIGCTLSGRQSHLDRRFTLRGRSHRSQPRIEIVPFWLYLPRL